MIKDQTEAISAVVDALLQSQSVLFITGAGVSAESGIPTYRGIGGLYNAGTTDEGFAIEEILSSYMLRGNPALCWKYLAQIGLAVQGAQHNRAHEIMAEMERHFDRLWVLTQNIDGFHRAAGSKNLIEVHGNLNSLSCMGCEHKVRVEEFQGLAIPPKCPRCTALLRPDVVLFGELIDGPGIEHLQTESARRASSPTFKHRCIWLSRPVRRPWRSIPARPRCPIWWTIASKRLRLRRYRLFGASLLRGRLVSTSLRPR